MNIYYQNVRGLRTKTNDFYVNSCSEMYDVVSLTETWLNESINSMEIFSDLYMVHRKDRVSSEKKWGGGVLIAVNSLNFLSERIFPLETDDCIWIRIELSDRVSLYLCSVYFSPCSSISRYEEFYERMEDYNFNTNDCIIITGDFNLLIGGTDPHKFDNRDAKVKNLNQFINYNGFHLLNNVKNKMERTLDLVISNVDLEVGKCDLPLSRVDEYHPPLLINLNRTRGRRRLNDCPNHEVSFDFKRGDYRALYEALNRCDWDPLYCIRDVDSALEFVYKNLFHSMNVSIPKKSKQIRRIKFPKWFSPSLKYKVKLKNRYRNLAKRHTNIKYKRRFMEIRKEVNRESKLCYKNYISKIEENLQSDPKRFWSYIKERRGINCRNEGTFKIEGNTAPTNLDIANSFAEYFSGNLASDRSMNCPGLGFPGNCVDCLTIKEITKMDIRHSLKNIKPRGSIGPDGIPPFIVKGCYDILEDPLYYVFNLSLRLGKFPEIWKVSRITPIFKKGKKDRVENYRPISILSTLAKLFEQILYKKILSYILKYISNHQHGFIPKRSVCSNLVSYMEYIYESMDEGYQVDAVYTDFSKAFDSVNHKLLLSKLDWYGFSEGLINLFSDYLKNRKQFVLFNNCKSGEYVMTRGVPQGSNLGPLLFIIFINDIVRVIKNCKFLLYADDLKLFKSIKDENDQLCIQKDLNSVKEWCMKNDLTLNIDKCSSMIFTRKSTYPKKIYQIDGVDLSLGESVLDLGITLDRKLNFNEHVDIIVCKSYKIMGLIKRSSFSFRNKSTLLRLFFSLVRPHLEYVPVVWYPYTNQQISQIEAVQKKFLRHLFYRSIGYHASSIPYGQLLEMFGMRSLAERRKVALLKFFYNILGGRVDCPELLSRVRFSVPAFNSRNRSLFHVGATRTVYGERAPIRNMSSVANAFAIDMISVKYNDFMKSIETVLGLRTSL